MSTATKRPARRQRGAQRPRRAPQATPSGWFSVHTHSHHSTLDATTEVPTLVARAVEHGYPAFGLSNHGNMAGCTTAYLECAKAGIPFFPGVELYLVDPDYTGSMDDVEFGKAERYHLCVWARTYEGYKALVRLVSLSHTRPRFNRFARVTWSDLCEFGVEHGEDVIVSTGCYFGLVQQRLVKSGRVAATQTVKAYASIFPNLFVELQHHNIDHSTTAEPSKWTDDAIVDQLVSVAETYGLPVMATQDSHYLDVKNRSAHGLMKKMVYGGSDDEFPGDSFHLASEDWVEEHYPVDVWQKCLEGAKTFLELHDLHIPLLDKFMPQVPTVYDDNGKPINAERYTIRLAEKKLTEITRGLSRAKTQRYRDQLDHEIDVIRTLGMFGYFAVILKVLDYCNAHDIAYEARGSANGSLYCYLLGITQADPVEEGLLFERFLSIDRTKPPDVDMDIEREHHAEVINFMRKTWGALRIGTFGNLGETQGAEGGTGKGSVLVTYKGWAARKAEAEGRDKGSVYNRLQTISDVQSFAPKDYGPLRQLADMTVYKGYGQHPGGVLLPGDEVDVHDVIPTMLVASSDSTVTQYDMDEVENWGFLKDDILSQATLTVMKLCQRFIGRENPRDFTWIPKNDPTACKLLRDGRTDTGIFHFEGYTKAKGGRELAVRSTRDAILVQALYMPGAMQSGQKDMFIARRRDTELRSRIRYLHPIFEKHLAETYGAVVYQEQVMQIWIDLGMSVASANAVLKVMKTSGKKSVGNVDRINKLRKEFEACCAAHGITDVDAAWNGTAGFASYGFNKAHAAGYGIRSYRCAYLKAHHPLEFMAALLMTHVGTDKEPPYVREARRMDLRVVSADVNESDMSWRIGEGKRTLVRGLVSLKGIGPAAAAELVNKRPFRNIDDLASRVAASQCSGGTRYITTGEWTGDLGKLKAQGALRSIGVGPTD